VPPLPRPPPLHPCPLLHLAATPPPTDTFSLPHLHSTLIVVSNICRFAGQRFMGQLQPYLGSAQPYPGSNLYPTSGGGMYAQSGVPYGVSAPTPGFGGHSASHGGNLGPGEASAGPRMFVGKLNKETSEGDIKVPLNPKPPPPRLVASHPFPEQYRSLKLTLPRQESLPALLTVLYG